MKEGYSNKALRDVLSPEYIRYLYEMIDHPGWEALKMVNRAVKEDWINQTALLDLSTKEDEEMLRILRTRNGMIKGIDMFMLYLERQRKTAQKSD